MSKQLPFLVDLSDPLSKWRAEEFWSKEVETLDWLKVYANCQDVPVRTLIDVGANIGMYSLFWLTLSESMHVVCCEPFPANSRLLKINMGLNNFENRFTLIENPLYATSEIGQLDVTDHRPGSSGSQFTSVDRTLTAHNSLVQSLTLDEIVLDYSKPSILKIDVDGLDFEILKGGTNALLSGCVHSLLIEAAEETQEEISEFLDSFDFVSDQRFNSLRDHSDFRRKSNNQLERNRVYTLATMV